MVYEWMGRIDEEGPPGLYDREREERPKKITEEVEEEIRPPREKTPHPGPPIGLQNTSTRSSGLTST